MAHRAHSADGDPENVSAAVGGRRKQVGLPQVLKGKAEAARCANGGDATRRFVCM